MNKYIESCNLLGLGDVVNESQLKIAYRQRVKQCHPDKYLADRAQYERAIEQTKRVNLAYSYLLDVVKNNIIIGSHQRNYNPGLPDDSVLEIPLKSTHTVSVGYDYECHTMFIKFANSKVYKFFGISPRIFEEFLTAKSHHRYAHQNIFFRFPYVACKM